MPMSEERAAKQLADFYIKLRDSGTYNGGCEVLRYLEKVCDAEFQKATPTYPNIDITTPAGTLYFGDCNESDVFKKAHDIAVGVTEYWAKTIEPTGEPQSCDDIDEVKNDVAKITKPLEQDILNIARNEIIRPYYIELFEVIFKHVRSIIWTVKESDSTCDETYEVKVE